MSGRLNPWALGATDICGICPRRAQTWNTQGIKKNCPKSQGDSNYCRKN